MTYCPKCGEASERGQSQDWQKGRYDEALPNVEVINIIHPCTKCGFGWNCMGTRKVK